MNIFEHVLSVHKSVPGLLRKAAPLRLNNLPRQKKHSKNNTVIKNLLAHLIGAAIGSSPSISSFGKVALHACTTV